METILEIFKWLFFDSVYGIILLAGIIYLLLSRIKKVIPKIPSPSVMAGLTIVIGLLTFPSIPRYQFSYETLSKIDGKPWIKIINKAYWGDVTEPLTWFSTPLGSVFIAIPYDPISMGSFDYFQEILLQYKKEEKIHVVQRFCKDKKIQEYNYDQKGTLRFASREPRVMTESEIERYCKYDWSRERKALLNAISTKN